MKATVLIRPKDGILDPQGEAVEGSLRKLGFAERPSNRLPLGVENAFLGTNQHRRLHSTTFGSER